VATAAGAAANASNSVPFGLYWYLNALCVMERTNKSSWPADLIPIERTTATDFTYARLNGLFWRWVPTRYACNANTTLFEPIAAAGSGGGGNSGDITPCIPAEENVLEDNAPFGAVSFAMYIVATMLVSMTGLWHGAASYAAHHHSRPAGHPTHAVQQRYAAQQASQRCVALGAQLACMALFLAGSGLLSHGVYSMHIEDVRKNFTGLAVAWCAAACGVAGVVSYAGAFWLWRGVYLVSPMVATGVGGRSRLPPGRTRRRGRLSIRRGGGWRNSLPIYRPREGMDDDMEELPPYAREDPMGRPPGIDSLVVAATRAASDCVALPAPVLLEDEDMTGRESPSPEYTEAGSPVEAVSPLDHAARRTSQPGPRLSMGGGGMREEGARPRSELPRGTGALSGSSMSAVRHSWLSARRSRAVEDEEQSQSPSLGDTTTTASPVQFKPESNSEHDTLSIVNGTGGRADLGGSGHCEDRRPRDSHESERRTENE
jgi:hypothetical protein